ncbi:hypothetical protein GT348_03630 [Aristophania vespae]|uniref:EamA family transporter n=1 Tax=Aristophania vespae TaxID=2697033 RepID=A0A6P1NAP7_9PROT|nr:hypothetical protein [Aristophania vespae]QHI95476.1 hypothetical protein GT348_03630 [Aristophania vespae]
MKGPAYILGYCVFGATIDVFLSNLLQSINLFVLLFWTFIFTWGWFFLNTIIFSSIKLESIIKSRKLILLLNISTLGSWAGLFIGLKWTEPSIMVAIIFALSPIISVLIEISQRNFIDKKNIITAVILLLSVALLMILAVQKQRSNPFDSNYIFALVLGFVCIVTSTSLTLGTYISKSLSNKGFSAVNVQSFRFPLLIAVCYLLIPNKTMLITVQSNFWMYLQIIVILGNILPLWMLQKGIELTNPLTVNIIINISPCITLLLELLDSSIKFSNMKLFVLLLLILTTSLSNNDVSKFAINKMKKLSTYLK